MEKLTHRRPFFSLQHRFEGRRSRTSLSASLLFRYFFEAHSFHAMTCQHLGCSLEIFTTCPNHCTLNLCLAHVMEHGDIFVRDFTKTLDHLDKTTSTLIDEANVAATEVSERFCQCCLRDSSHRPSATLDRRCFLFGYSSCSNGVSTNSNVPIVCTMRGNSSFDNRWSSQKMPRDYSNRKETSYDDRNKIWCVISGNTISNRSKSTFLN